MLDRAYSEVGDDSETSAGLYAHKDDHHQQERGDGGVDDDDPLSHIAELRETDTQRSRGVQRVRYETSHHGGGGGPQQSLVPGGAGGAGDGSPSDSHWSLSQPSPSVSELKGLPFSR